MMKNIGKYFLIIIIIFIGFQAAILFHELGHCVFYWIQGIPSRMSWMKEYPMHDISVVQYQIGSWGGIVFNWILLVFLFFSSIKLYKNEKSIALFFTKLLFYSASLALILYAIFLFKGKDKWEFIYAQNLFNLPNFAIIIFTLIFTLTMLYFFIKKLKLKVKTVHIGITILILFISLFYISIMEDYDRKTNWHKYPTIKVGNEFIYNVIK